MQTLDADRRAAREPADRRARDGALQERLHEDAGTRRPTRREPLDRRARDGTPAERPMEAFDAGRLGSFAYSGRPGQALKLHGDV